MVTTSDVEGVKRGIGLGTSLRAYRRPARLVFPIGYPISCKIELGVSDVEYSCLARPTFVLGKPTSKSTPLVGIRRGELGRLYRFDYDEVHDARRILRRDTRSPEVSHPYLFYYSAVSQQCALRDMDLPYLLYPIQPRWGY